MGGYKIDREKVKASIDRFITSDGDLETMMRRHIDDGGHIDTLQIISPGTVGSGGIGTDFSRSIQIHKNINRCFAQFSGVCDAQIYLTRFNLVLTLSNKWLAIRQQAMDAAGYFERKLFELDNKIGGYMANIALNKFYSDLHKEHPVGNYMSIRMLYHLKKQGVPIDKYVYELVKIAHDSISLDC